MNTTDKPTSRSRPSLEGRDVQALVPISFEDAYPRVRKDFCVPPDTIPFPEAMALPESKAWSRLRGDTYTTPDDFVSTLRNTLYCTTNGVLLPERRRVLVESMNGAETFSKSLDPVLASAFETKEVIEGYATLFNSNFNGYYHQLVEMIPRLLALNRKPYTYLKEIKLLCPPQVYPTASFVISRLGTLNLRPIYLDPGRILEVENLLFTPFKTRQFAGYLAPRYVRELRKALLHERPSARHYRIFISRMGSNKRRIRNEDEVMAALSPLGFERYILEDLSAEEQVELFRDADVVVGTHGAGLANVLFSPGTKVLELFPREFVEPHYLFLCKSLGHVYRFLCNRASSKWDWEFVSYRLRKRLERGPSLTGRWAPRLHSRSNNLSHTVDARAVCSILAEMAVR